MSKNLLLILGFCSIATIASAQVQISKKEKQELSAELYPIYYSDQIYHEFKDEGTQIYRKKQIAAETHYTYEDLEKNIDNVLAKINKENLEKVEKIIAKYGYPGKSMVGEPLNQTVFYVILHNPQVINKYFPLIELAGYDNEIPYYLAATMLDSKLVGVNLPQIYGSQYKVGFLPNNGSGERKKFIYTLPIDDAENVNERRKVAGFPTTIEEYAKKHGFLYKVYTKTDLINMGL